MTLLVKSLRKRLTPNTEVSDDLRREIRNLKKYSNDVFEADVKLRIEDIDEETKENAKKECFKAMREADEILYPKDPKLEALMDSLDDDDTSEGDHDDKELDLDTDETVSVLEAVEELEEFDDKFKEIDDEICHEVVTEVFVLELGHDDPMKSGTYSNTDEDTQVESDSNCELNGKPDDDNVPSRKNFNPESLNPVKVDENGEDNSVSVVMIHETPLGEIEQNECDKCKSELQSKFSIRSHMHRKHVRIRFECVNCGHKRNVNDFMMEHSTVAHLGPSVSWWFVSDVTDLSISERLEMRFLNLETEEAFKPKTKNDEW